MITAEILRDVLADPIAAVERLAADSGVEMKDVLEATSLSRSTFTRWKAGGFDPRLSSVRRLADGVDVVKARMAAAA